jgi:hypothetical protein
MASFKNNASSRFAFFYEIIVSLSSVCSYLFRHAYPLALHGGSCISLISPKQRQEQASWEKEGGK